MQALQTSKLKAPKVDSQANVITVQESTVQACIRLAQSLEYLHTKRELRPPKKHGLIPL